MPHDDTPPLLYLNHAEMCFLQLHNVPIYIIEMGTIDSKAWRDN